LPDGTLYRDTVGANLTFLENGDLAALRMA
jgi:hypothetical protein